MRRTGRWRRETQQEEEEEEDSSSGVTDVHGHVTVSGACSVGAPRSTTELSRAAFSAAKDGCGGEDGASDLPFPRERLSNCALRSAIAPAA